MGGGILHPRSRLATSVLRSSLRLLNAVAWPDAIPEAAGPARGALPGLGKPSAGPAGRLGSGAQGRSGTQTAALTLLSLQVRATRDICTRALSHLCVMLVTRFFPSFSSVAFKATSSERREARRFSAGRFCLPGGGFTITFTGIFLFTGQHTPIPALSVLW